VDNRASRGRRGAEQEKSLEKRSPLFFPLLPTPLAGLPPRSSPVEDSSPFVVLSRCIYFESQKKGAGKFKRPSCASPLVGVEHVRRRFPPASCGRGPCGPVSVWEIPGVHFFFGRAWRRRVHRRKGKRREKNTAFPASFCPFFFYRKLTRSLPVFENERRMFQSTM
jgi:hypothetical protein